MEDAYNILATHKQEGESFSEEIRRLFSPKDEKRPLMDFFGTISEKEGDAILESMELRRKENKKRIKMRKNLFDEIA